MIISLEWSTIECFKIIFLIGCWGEQRDSCVAAKWFMQAGRPWGEMVHTSVKSRFWLLCVLLECYISCRINADYQPCLKICLILNSYPVKIALWLPRVLLPLMWKNVSFCGLDLPDRQFWNRAQDFWINFNPSYDHQAFILKNCLSLLDEQLKGSSYSL